MIQRKYCHLPEDSRLLTGTYPRRTIFLDRDGVLNEDVDFLIDLHDLHILPGALDFLKTLHPNFMLIVTTNQSGIARGYFSEADLLNIHTEMHTRLEGLIDAYYYCPFHPTEAVVEQFQGDPACRKPQPGMILNAAQEWELELAASFTVGDRLRDPESGSRAGTTAIWLSDSPEEPNFPCHKAKSLSQVQALILASLA